MKVSDGDRNVNKVRKLAVFWWILKWSRIIFATSQLFRSNQRLSRCRRQKLMGRHCLNILRVIWFCAHQKWPNCESRRSISANHTNLAKIARRSRPYTRWKYTVNMRSFHGFCGRNPVHRSQQNFAFCPSPCQTVVIGETCRPCGAKKTKTTHPACSCNKWWSVVQGVPKSILLQSLADKSSTV